MSHRFNSLAGRLVKSGQAVAQGLRPAKESSEIIYGPGFKVAKVSNEPLTSASSGGVPKHLLEKYRKFQEPSGNNIPIHLRGGPGDKILFYSTVLLCGVGLEECFRFYFTAAFPKSKD